MTRATSDPRAAVVTGGGRGIGASITRAFHEAGYRVVILSRRDSGLAAELGSRAIHMTCDVTRRSQLEDAMARVAGWAGGLDVLVNNAGVSGWRPIEAIDETFWREMVDTNLTGVLFACQAALPHLRSGSAIVNVSSLAGKRGSANNSAYCAATNPGRAAGLVLVDYSPENAPQGAKRVTDTVAAQPDVFPSVDAAMRYFGVEPDSPGGKAKRARFEAYLRAVPGGVQLKRDLHFRDQFRRVKETGERPKLGVDMWQVLGELACPALVMRGAQSDMFAPETAAKVKAANPRIRLVEVAGGHNIAGDNPDGFLAAIGPFLKQLEAAS